MPPSNEQRLKVLEDFLSSHKETFVRLNNLEGAVEKLLANQQKTADALSELRNGMQSLGRLLDQTREQLLNVATRADAPTAALERGAAAQATQLQQLVDQVQGQLGQMQERLQDLQTNHREQLCHISDKLEGLQLVQMVPTVQALPPFVPPTPFPSQIGIGAQQQLQASSPTPILSPLPPQSTGFIQVNAQTGQQNLPPLTLPQNPQQGIQQQSGGFIQVNQGQPAAPHVLPQITQAQPVVLPPR